MRMYGESDIPHGGANAPKVLDHMSALRDAREEQPVSVGRGPAAGRLMGVNDVVLGHTDRVHAGHRDQLVYVHGPSVDGGADLGSLEQCQCAFLELCTARAEGAVIALERRAFTAQLDHVPRSAGWVVARELVGAGLSVLSVTTPTLCPLTVSVLQAFAGVDGVIREDRLGLDQIYVQAKKWTDPVGRPEIQKFLGALHGQRASKGVFITTSSFTRGARDFANDVTPRVILVDGRELAGFMIDYRVGVTPTDTYTLVRLDSDYFDADNTSVT